MLYLEGAPEQTATALGPDAGRALGGELDLLTEGERRKRRRRRRGKAATALLSAVGSSGVCARQQAGTEGVKASPRHIAPPARLGRTVGLGPRLRMELVPGKTSAGSGSQRGWELPCGYQERFAFGSQPKLEVCGYRCALPLLPPLWSTSD